MLAMTVKKAYWDAVGFWTLVLFTTSSAIFYVDPISCQVNRPMPCKQAGSSCPAYMSYSLPPGNTIDDVSNLFQVEVSDIMEQKGVASDRVMVSVNCTCTESFQYLAGTAYRVTSQVMTEQSIVKDQYQHLGYATGQKTSVGQMLPISLLCGCMDNAPASVYLMSYVFQNRDTFEALRDRYGADTNTLLRLNNLTDVRSFPSMVVFYIPISQSQLKQASVGSQLTDTNSTAGGNIPLGAIVGIVLTGLLLVAAVAALVFFLQKRRMCCYARSKPPFNQDRSSSSSRDTLQDWKGFLGCFRAPQTHHIRNPNSNVKRHISLSKEMMNGVFGMEKPVIFPYDEILIATDEFTEKNHLGAGAYGSVFQGKLRGQDVAIKRMKATKRKEFFAELKVLCKVHHTNLVELIGYSVSDDELFLVYEFAENRAVSDRLHDPLSKEYTPLTWNARVQIALDTARGLEYIHEHTKAHYVHRDVKTSNILLDSSFRAKVADFGLAKLVEQSSDGETTTTGVVGTSGYLAPEYLRDGQATAKSDVYAFGVVLFELITGEEAFSKSRTSGNVPPDKRSLISIMLSALGDSSPYNMAKLKLCVDPLLQEMYPLDCVHRMATLGRQCVEEDPAVRPDMKQVVYTLSQLLLGSIEWEATLAGSSQVFSGLVIGR
ncbi:protein MpRLK-Pelle_LysM3 [Marchantia polymorpha subsp. ruderalis]|uniref:Protein kinase domain-containing protein n=2 Tax=Marchantia polymorpha TaxID=3197 RepID=A0AAF6BSD7_MARPO|nr:hypothetical protein MARPO_0056s0067 [Marchantia polymorpha]BBN14921.1 hypothetical protein Mp_6g15550 [Marchantia polymorpha subsp. ruderalis]|eukprot:PTQ37605.1 hypothetical protein MARPO_0056s0067 [Marchantia polymorpha]